MAIDREKLRRELESLSRLKFELEEQDTLILEQARRAPSSTVGAPQIAVLETIFTEVNVLRPHLLVPFIRAGEPDNLRPQIRSARARVDEQINRLKQSLEAPAKVVRGWSDLTVSDPREVFANGRHIEKTVFISYRRIAVPWAVSIFQDLTHHGYDVFFDFQGIASGGFEEVILENIKARAHFLVLLTPSALGRCVDPDDLFRREIETAIAVQRNIVPIMLEGFEFSAPEIDSQLGDTLDALKRYNGLRVYADYVSEAMDRLRKNYLNVPLKTVLHPVSPSTEQVAKDEQAAAAGAPPVTEAELKATAQLRYLFYVKNKHEDQQATIEGTNSEEPFGAGSLIIYDGNAVVARYADVEEWFRGTRVSTYAIDPPVAPEGNKGAKSREAIKHEVLDYLRQSSQANTGNCLRPEIGSERDRLYSEMAGEGRLVRTPIGYMLPEFYLRQT